MLPMCVHVLRPGAIFTRSFRVGPSWLLKSRSCKSPKHRAKCHAVDSMLDVYPRGTSNREVIQNLSLPPVWNCFLATPSSDSLVAIFMEPFQLK